MQSLTTSSRKRISQSTPKDEDNFVLYRPRLRSAKKRISIAEPILISSDSDSDAPDAEVKEEIIEDCLSSPVFENPSISTVTDVSVREVASDDGLKVENKKPIISSLSAHLENLGNSYDINKTKHSETGSLLARSIEGNQPDYVKDAILKEICTLRDNDDSPRTKSVREIVTETDDSMLIIDADRDKNLNDGNSTNSNFFFKEYDVKSGFSVCSKISFTKRSMSDDELVTKGKYGGPIAKRELKEMLELKLQPQMKENQSTEEACSKTVIVPQANKLRAVEVSFYY